MKPWNRVNGRCLLQRFLLTQLTLSPQEKDSSFLSKLTTDLYLWYDQCWQGSTLYRPRSRDWQLLPDNWDIRHTNPGTPCSFGIPLVVFFHCPGTSQCFVGCSQLVLCYCDSNKHNSNVKFISWIYRWCQDFIIYAFKISNLSRVYDQQANVIIPGSLHWDSHDPDTSLSIIFWHFLAIFFLTVFCFSSGGFWQE